MFHNGRSVSLACVSQQRYIVHLKNRISPLGWGMPFPKAPFPHSHRVRACVPSPGSAAGAPPAPRRSHPQVAMLDLFLRIVSHNPEDAAQLSSPRSYLPFHAFLLVYFHPTLGTHHKMHPSVEFASGLLILVPNLPSLTGFPGGFCGAIEHWEYARIRFHWILYLMHSVADTWPTLTGSKEV